MELNSSPARCWGVPLPAEAKLSVLPVLARASSSATVFTPSEGCTSSTSGKADSCTTGSRSLSGLKGMLLYSEEFTAMGPRSEEHTSELQSRLHLVCRLLLEKKKNLKSQVW